MDWHLLHLSIEMQMQDYKGVSKIDGAHGKDGKMSCSGIAHTSFY